MSEQQTPPKKVNSRAACLSCRTKHQRCDGAVPECDRCKGLGRQCIYVESLRGKRRNKQKHEKLDVTTSSTYGHHEPTDSNALQSILEEIFASRAASPELPVAAKVSIDSLSLQKGYTCNHIAPEVRANANFADSACFLCAWNNDRTIDKFYTHFFPGHPFILPRKYYMHNPLISLNLLKVIRFIGSRYLYKEPIDMFYDDAMDACERMQGVISLEAIQVFLATSTVCHLIREEQKSLQFLKTAVDIAIQLRIFDGSVVDELAMDNRVLRESYIRTAWSVICTHIVIPLMVADMQNILVGDMPKRLPLPCEELAYDICNIPDYKITLEEVENGHYVDSPLSLSSFGYYILSVRLMLEIQTVPANSPMEEQRQRELANLKTYNFFLSMPPEKREVTEMGGFVDEMLFAAHTIGYCAVILLHRPQADLESMLVETEQSCKLAFASSGLVADGENNSHTAKALSAAASLSRLYTITHNLSRHSTCLMCSQALVCAFLVPYLASGSQGFDKNTGKEYIILSLNVLKELSRVWPAADVLRRQTLNFALQSFLDIDYAFKANPYILNDTYEEDLIKDVEMVGNNPILK